MSNDKGIPSRLAQRVSGGGPVRGIGSGFAENQKIVGARDPDAAARVAATDPEEMSRILEEQEKAAALAGAGFEVRMGGPVWPG